mgnify:CR=1 FL=1
MLSQILLKSKIILVILGVLFVTQTATGLTIKEASLEELTSESVLVVRGTIVEQFSQWDADHRNIYTYNTMEIQQVLRGNISSETVMVRELGGTVGEVTAEVNGLRYLNTGDDVILFLRETDENNVYKIHSFTLGKFNIVSEGGAIVVKNALGTVNILNHNQPAAKTVTSPVELSGFLQRLSAIR